jgi:hypothetical protein
MKCSSLKSAIGVCVPKSTKIKFNLIIGSKSRSYQESFRTSGILTRAASDKDAPNDHLNETQVPKTPIYQQSPIKIDMPPTTTTPLQHEPALPSALREMELLREDVSARTLERWAAAYTQMSRDAQELGIPASAIPPLSANPTKEELRQARDHLDRMMQSFLSAGL